jgi:hypothetical protein
MDGVIFAPSRLFSDALFGSISTRRRDGPGVPNQNAPNAERGIPPSPGT